MPQHGDWPVVITDEDKAVSDGLGELEGLLRSPDTDDADWVAEQGKQLIDRLLAPFWAAESLDDFSEDEVAAKELMVKLHFMLIAHQSSDWTEFREESLVVADRLAAFLDSL